MAKKGCEEEDILGLMEHFIKSAGDIEIVFNKLS
jgi:hypothetical protein